VRRDRDVAGFGIAKRVSPPGGRVKPTNPIAFACARDLAACDGAPV
jgi:hypothetical protein